MPKDRALEFLQNIRHQAENPGEDPLTENAGVIEDKNLSLRWEITYHLNPAVSSEIHDIQFIISREFPRDFYFTKEKNHAR